MPNHLHGILAIVNVGTGRDLSNNNPPNQIGGTRRDLYNNKRSNEKSKIKPLSQIIGAFKTTSSKIIHETGLTEFTWQRSYYDHIIRDEKSLNNIREYILQNPQKWELEKENVENMFM